MNYKTALSGAFLLVFFMVSCTQKSGDGTLGIQVPIGDGKVSKTTPYVIVAVVDPSPALRAGILPDDVIVQINEVPISNGMRYEDIYQTLLKGKAGTKVTIVVDRKGNRMVFDVVREPVRE